MSRLAALLAVWLFALASPAFAAPQRLIAVTIDDLPYASGGLPCTTGEARRFTGEFLDMLRAQKLPVTGFANPGRNCDGPIIHGDTAILLAGWLEAGFDLGSHTNTHPNINSVGLAAYEADVIAAEATLAPLLREHGKTLTWFRHPFLRTGESADIQQNLTRFLDRRGYRVAAVTFDNSEWVFAAAYARALRKGDTAEARRIGEAYVDYMQTIAAFFEDRSMAILGREPPQVLLIHANQLNRDWFPAVRGMLAARGYHFVSLAQAQSDPAYDQADTYVGRYGMSWILRWGLAKGVPLVREPDAPDWVTTLSEAPLTPMAQAGQ